MSPLTHQHLIEMMSYARFIRLITSAQPAPIRLRSGASGLTNLLTVILPQSLSVSHRNHASQQVMHLVENAGNDQLSLQK